jgi:predicted metalloendopeptidase
MKFKNIVLSVSAAALLTAFVAGGDYRALNLNFIDSSVNPGDDFYSFVNGKWMKQTEIPSDRGRWGSFDALGKMADSMALEVLKTAAKSGDFSADSDQGKAIALYSSVMDLSNRNKQGVKPLVPYLMEIASLKTKKDISNYMVKYAPYGGGFFLGFYVGADVKNSNQNVMYSYGPGLGLPDRDYYLKTDEKSVKLQAAYKKFIVDVFKAYNWQGNPENIAETIYGMEKYLAENKMSRVEMRDPAKRYNPKSLKEFKKMHKGMDVDGMLKALGVSPDKIIVGDVKNMEAAAKMFKERDVEDLKALLLWSDMRGGLENLSQELEQLRFDFYGKTLRGTPAQRPQEERALAVVNGTLGEALGKLYVEKYFPEEAKKVAKQMVDDVIAAYRVRINNLDWMSAETKKKANVKLDKMMVKIGYPDKWEDYSQLTIKTYAQGGSYFQNMLNAAKWGMAQNMAEFGKPVDKSKWGMSPQTVNAYYNPVNNEIVFPAAILQPPFFDFRNDPAVNFGGIGAVIGHEISHGFDDAGAQFDADGNLKNWWTEQDLKQFKERGKKLAEQYSSYEALPGKYVNGEFTLGENIGDLGGVASAYDGLMIHLKREPVAQKLDGFTQPQRFFLSWATIWRSKIRDEELSMRLVTDPHSPGYFRAIGPLQNHPGFYEAFGVKEGHKMYKADQDRVKIW